MLELPESYHIAKQVEEHLKGKIISYIEVLHTPHKFAFFQGDRDAYEELLEGQTIEGAVNRGGMYHREQYASFVGRSISEVFRGEKEIPKESSACHLF